MSEGVIGGERQPARGMLREVNLQSMVDAAPEILEVLDRIEPRVDAEIRTPLHLIRAARNPGGWRVDVVGERYVGGVGPNVTHVDRKIVSDGVLHVQVPKIQGEPRFLIGIASGGGTLRRIQGWSTGCERSHRSQAVAACCHRGEDGGIDSPGKRLGYD